MPIGQSQRVEARVERAIAYWRESAQNLSLAIPHSDPPSPDDLRRIEGARICLQERDQAFDERVARSRGILMQLAERGAEPLYVIGNLLTYASARATETPRPSSLTIRRWKLVMACVLCGTGTVRRLESRPRRRGPAEALRTTGMVLLHRHFKRQTGGNYWRQIAALYLIWGARGGQPHPLSGDHVERRVLRARKKHKSELRREISHDALRYRVNRAAFRKFVRHATS